jgi:hypothetical protein
MSAETVPPLSIIELDQDDIVARLKADSYFSGGIPVLEQRLGITENDVSIAVSTANAQGGLVGTVAIVLMPRLRGTDPNAPGPRYIVRYPIQVIDWPVVRRQSVGGSQVSAEEACDRIRQILHGFNPLRSQGQLQFTFDSVEPTQVKEGQVSYIVTFRRLGTDAPPTSCAAVGIYPSSGTGPLTVTLTCATPGASIYYTVDGTYPSSVNVAPAGTAQLYSGPFTAPQGATVRAAAQLSGYQQSNVISQVAYS